MLFRNYKLTLTILIGVLVVNNISSCKKLVQIPPPANSITTSQVFADSADAAAAISGIYAKIIGQTGDASCNGLETILCGLSSDELVSFNNGNTNQTQFYFNALESDNGIVPGCWTTPYTIIYQTNACIEGLQNSTSLTSTTKNQFLGEAKFFRSLFYFYLINFFGNVPYVASINWLQTDTLGNATPLFVYQNIINDLKSAKSLLPSDYSFSSGNRTRVNKLGAAALLARVYLYLQDWKNAKLESDSIINNNLFSLVDLDNVFLANSQESILQWQLNTSYVYGTSTNEGVLILPANQNSPPGYYLSSELLNAFDSSDGRKTAWLNQSKYAGVTYVYPYKYKRGRSQVNLNGTATEYYTVFRLAEQYLIRAEAEANGAGSSTSAAISDLNIIRKRADLPPLSPSLSGDSLMAAIAHERRIELFAEWGHRWFDLRRTAKIDSIMTIITPKKNPGGVWQNYQQLYPIPLSQLSVNPFLKQNIGY
jgi:hypothetical protein